MVRVCRVLILLSVVNLAASNLFAQQLSITGTVDDGTGVVPDVTVTLKDATSSTSEVMTDTVGKYRIGGLKRGNYQLIVGREGYATATRQVVLEQSRIVDITLQVGAISTSVDVVGAASGTLTNSLISSTNAGSRLNITALDTPASVTTLSGTDIRLRGDVSVNSSVTRAVGITSTLSVGGGGNTVAARGFGGSSVAFMYDGIRNQAGLGNLGWPYDPWTIDRIEVLNGPSSVLFGIGGIGGSINIIPRRPSRRPEHTVRVAGASFGTYRLAFDATGPIAGSERVLYRVDVSKQASDGYINDGKSQSTAFSGALDFLISPKFKATLINDFAFIEPMNYNGLPVVAGVAQESLLRENFATGDVDVHFHENSSRLEMTWTPNSEMAVRNITSLLRGLRLWKQGPSQLQYRAVTNDVLRTGFGRFDQDQNQWNNQIEFTWRRKVAGHENTFVAGTDGEWLDFTRYVTQWPGQHDIVSLVNPKPVSYPTVAGTTTQAQNNKVHRYSLFTEDRFKLTSKLALVGGLRWDTQNLNRIDLVTDTRAFDVEKRYNPVNGRAGAVYEVMKDMNVYAEYSAATDALSNACCITAAQMAFDAARGMQFETGVKQVLGGGRAEWTLAAYRIVKNDLLIPDPIRIATLVQVGQQSSTGVEATASFDFGHGFRLGVNGTVLRPRYDDFFEVVAGQRVSRAGNRPTNVPWQSGNVLAFWSFRQNWLAQGTLRFVGDRYIDNANTLVLPSYAVVDAGVRRSLSNTVALDFRVTNLGSAFYAYNFTSNGLGGGNWNVGPPRAYEVSLTTGF